MKTLTFIAALLIAATANAWEFQGNPDRFPSLGINYTSRHLAGDRDENDTPSGAPVRTQTGRAKDDTMIAGADLRLPVSDQVTFTVGAESFSNETTFHRAQGVYNDNQSLTGYSASIGLRYYFNR